MPRGAPDVRHVGSCEAAAHRGGMPRTGLQAQCIPVLHTPSSVPCRRSYLSRTTLLQAHLGLEKTWRMVVYNRMSVGQGRGDSGWSMAGREKKRGCKKQAGLDTQTQGGFWTESCGRAVGRSQGPRTACSASSRSPAHHQRGTAETCVLVPAQPRTAMSLPPLTLLAQHHFQKSPGPRGQSFFACWLALPPTLKIGQLPSLQFKGSLPLLTSCAEANS